MDEDYNEYSITLVTILPFHCDTNGAMIEGNFESLNASEKQSGSISIVALIFILIVFIRFLFGLLFQFDSLASALTTFLFFF